MQLPTYADKWVCSRFRDAKKVITHCRKNLIRAARTKHIKCQPSNSEKQGCCFLLSATF